MTSLLRSDFCSTRVSFLIVSISLSLISTAIASSGDESFAFRQCVSQCQAKSAFNDCNYAVPSSFSSSAYMNTSDKSLPAAVCSHVCIGVPSSTEITITTTTHPTKLSFLHPLMIMQWDCLSDCRYHCMWLLENKKKASSDHSHTPVEKYFGKWPFLRFLGAQEPASVLFSLFNLFGAAACLLSISQQIAIQQQNNHKKKWTSSYPTKERKKKSALYAMIPSMWTWYFFLSCNAWLWSSVFHCRDTKSTEKFDYYSAGLLVVYNLFLTLVRTVITPISQVYVTRSGPSSASSSSTAVYTTSTSSLRWPNTSILSLEKLITWLVGLVLFLTYARHVHSMHFILFDYGRHVLLCIIAGAIQTIIWLMWSFFTIEGRSHQGRKYLHSFMVLVNLAMLLEVLDFPPAWYVVDAHALWHLCTAPLTYLWYRFVKADISMCG